VHRQPAPKALGYMVSRAGPGAWSVSALEAAGPAAGLLQRGDLVTAVNGDARAAEELPSRLRLLRPGDTYRLRVVRQGSPSEVALRVGERPGARPSVWQGTAVLLVSLSFLCAALVIGVARPRELTIRLYAWANLLAALTLIVGLLHYEELSQDERFGYTLFSIASSFFPALMYHGYERLPPGLVLGPVWRWLRYALYAWCCLRFAGVSARLALELSGAETTVTFFHEHPLLWRAMVVVWQLREPMLGLAFLAGLALIGRNYRAARQLAQRRRLQWVIWGALTGIVPNALMLLLAPTPFARSHAYLVFDAMAPLFTVLTPATFVYAVLKHDILDVGFMVRRGLQYLMARGVLQVVLFVPLVVFVVANRDRTVADIVLHVPIERPHYVLLAVLAVAALRYRETLNRWLDRKFFREAYEEERVLLALAGEVQRQASLSEIARLVVRELDSSIHPETMHLLFRRPDRRDLVVEQSTSATFTLSISEESRLVRLLSGHSAAEDYPAIAPSLPEQEARALQELGIVLLVPAAGADGQLSGLLLLGRKRSQEPYSAKDRRLLEAVAGQIAVVYENAQLRRAAREEARVRRQVLSRLGNEGINVLKECPTCGRCYDRREERCGDDGTALALTLPIERVIDGKYRLERLLGKGGMGAVYEATDLRLTRTVAVKVLIGSSFGDEDALRRFSREARASARLSHPNIVTVHDYGGLGSEGAYLVMERLVGRTLRTELREAGAVDTATAADWFDQVLDAVAHAHRGGVVHRDLKPENVFLTGDRRGVQLKVLDFGLAKLTDAPEESRELTSAGRVIGTLSYMSPERLSAGTVDERSDVYSLGVMVFEALTGKNPFSKGDHTRVVAAVLHEVVRLPGDGAEHDALDALLQECLAKDPENRIASVAEMRRRLLPALRSCPVSASPRRRAVGPAESDPTRPM